MPGCAVSCQPPAYGFSRRKFASPYARYASCVSTLIGVPGEGRLISSDGGVPGVARSAVDDARVVEMDVRLDQAGTGKAPSRVVGFRCTRQPSLNRDDPASDNADIERL